MTANGSFNPFSAAGPTANAWGDTPPAGPASNARGGGDDGGGRLRGAGVSGERPRRRTRAGRWARPASAAGSAAFSLPPQRWRGGWRTGQTGASSDWGGGARRGPRERGSTGSAPRAASMWPAGAAASHPVRLRRRRAPRPTRVSQDVGARDVPLDLCWRLRPPQRGEERVAPLNLRVRQRRPRGDIFEARERESRC
jgi:hypothetical protein